MSEVLISPNFDKSLSNSSFVDLNEPANNISSHVTLDGIGRFIDQLDQTHVHSSYDTPAFRLPLKQAAKTFFREKSSKLIIESAVNDKVHHNHRRQEQKQNDSSLRLNKLNSVNGDCSTSVPTNEHKLLSSALTSHSAKQSACNRTPFMRSSIIYNVLNANNANDIVKNVHSKKIIPLKVSLSLNDNNIQRLDSHSTDCTRKTPHSQHIDSSIFKSPHSSHSSDIDNCADITMVSSPNSSPCESPHSPSLTSSRDHSSYQQHPHNLSHQQPQQQQSPANFRLNSLIASNGIDHQMASISLKPVTQVQKIITNNGNRSSASMSITSMHVSSGKSVTTTSTDSNSASNNSCANGNNNQLDHHVNENGPRNGPGRRDPKCARCQNHNVFIKVKGHKLLCPFKNCRCKKCRLVKKRQKIMAKQVKVRRAQTSYGENRLESDQIDALIGDDDIDDGDDEDDVDDGENSRISRSKGHSGSGSNVKNHESNGEKGFFMENLLRVDDDKTISPAILDSFYQLLLIRLSVMNISVAYEIALRMATSSILELASISKTNSNEILEKKFESAIGLLKNRYPTHYYPFYESNVLTSLLGSNESRTSHHESSMTNTSPNSSDHMNEGAHDSATTSNNMSAHNGAIKVHLSPIVDLRNQHSLFTNGTTTSSNSSSTNSSHNNHSTNSNHHGHSLHTLNSLARNDSTTSNLLSHFGHLHLYTNNNDDSHTGQLLHLNAHRSTHFLPHHNHFSAPNRLTSPPESPNLPETHNQFVNYNRMNSVSSSNISSSSPSPPS